jgi:hypothetical protein
LLDSKHLDRISGRCNSKHRDDRWDALGHAWGLISGVCGDFQHFFAGSVKDAGYTVGASNGKGEDYGPETAIIPSLATRALCARGDRPDDRHPSRWMVRLVASPEAQLQAAQIELRRTNNTMAVVLKQIESAENLIAEFQDMMTRFAMTLHGDTKKTALLMEKRCQDWRIAQQRIQL